MSKKIYVGNLPYSITEEEMRIWFARKLRYSKRSISPGRGSQYGHSELLSLEVIERWDVVASRKKSNGAAETDPDAPPVEEQPEVQASEASEALPS